MKVATIKIRSVKIDTPEPLCNATDGGGGDRAAAATTTTTIDTTITYPVSIRVFEAPVLGGISQTSKSQFISNYFT